MTDGKAISRDQWAQTKWGAIEKGDFVKGMKSETIFRVDESTSDGRLVALTLFSPSTGEQFGTREASKPCRVRILKSGERTAAGRRDDGLSAEGEAALKNLLGAEMIAHQIKGKPFVVPARFDAASLAGHLKIMHNLETGAVKPQDGPGLRATHKEAHAATPQSYTGQRLPHVHDEKSFQEGVK